MLITRFLQGPDDPFKHIRFQILVTGVNPLLSEDTVGFDLQAVYGQMRQVHLQKLHDISLYILQCLSREPEDQVDGQILESCPAKNFHRLPGFLSRMPSAN